MESFGVTVGKTELLCESIKQLYCIHVSFVDVYKGIFHVTKAQQYICLYSMRIQSQIWSEQPPCHISSHYLYFICCYQQKIIIIIIFKLLLFFLQLMQGSRCKVCTFLISDATVKNILYALYFNFQQLTSIFFFPELIFQITFAAVRILHIRCKKISLCLATLMRINIAQNEKIKT